jgi:hypothetical protein
MAGGEEAQLRCDNAKRTSALSRGSSWNFAGVVRAWSLLVEAEPVSNDGSLSAAGHTELGQNP